jgi:hypothetical protein
MTGVENPYPVTRYGYIYYIPLWAHDFGVNNYDLRYPAVIGSEFASHITQIVQICTYPSAVIIPAKQTICYNNAQPTQLTSIAAQPQQLLSIATNFVSAEYQWKKSVNENKGVWSDWEDVTEEITANYTPPPSTQSTAYRVMVSETNSGCNTTVYSDAVVITMNPRPDYPDIRVYACPDAGDINLAKYLDTADIEPTIQWAHQIPSISLSGGNAGVISTTALVHSRIHTLTYIVNSSCVSDNLECKVYLEILRNGVTRPLKDTISICHLYTEAVNINQQFGIEAGRNWEYYAINPANASIADYVTESTSQTYKGTVVMNGKAIYEDDDIQTGSYNGFWFVKTMQHT